MKEEWIILAGSPFDGFSHYGTFESFDQAQEWADTKIGFTVEWWVAKLDNPSEL